MQQFIEITDISDNKLVFIKINNIISIAEVEYAKCSIKINDGIETYFINAKETIQEIKSKISSFIHS